MKIWIINPPFPGGAAVREGRCMQKKEMWSSLWPPTSLAYIAALLQEDGQEIKAFDCVASELDEDAFFLKINSDEPPHLAVINTATPTIENDMRFVRRLKTLFPETTIAVFGMHPSALPAECLKEGADIAIIGEPENSIKIIARSLADGSEARFEEASFMRKKSDGSVETFFGNPFATDLDQIPFPAWNLFDLSKYVMPGKDMTPRKFLTVTPSRGCPHSCSFCNAASYYGKKIRPRNPIKVVDEIENNVRLFGVNDFLMWTESFTMTPAAEKICDEIIKRGLKINWVCNSRTNAASLPLFHKMRKAGCWMISFGVESGDQKILDAANKGALVSDSEKAIALAKKAGLMTIAHTIIGLPGETVDSVKKTWKLLGRTKPDFAQFYCAVPFPGSKLYKNALQNGWIRKGSRFAEFDQMQSVMDLPTMTAEETMKLKKLSYLKYYFNVDRIFRLIRRSSIKGILYAARNAIMLLISETSKKTH
ncbi:MAG: B12-binding domain-containing radical SAM protein [Patescibacteria group bacterium]|nr:B12-binding domain-containing radical SAM protein [Patescibacteria group bacterium]MCL5261766.1 B12-binding domain-containing radical SAM protein [Patescibacteria group bacterium]